MKSQKEIIKGLVKSSKIKKQLKEKITKILSLHDKMKKSYFYNSPSNASSRRSYEKYNSQTIEFKLGDVIYTVDQVTRCTCSNVYYNLIISANKDVQFNLNASFLTKILDAIYEFYNKK